MTDRIKRGDLLPRWEAILYDGAPKAGNEITDLANASSIRVLGRKDGVLLVDRSATGTNTSGHVWLDWQTGDTLDVGTIHFEVEVTWPGVKPQTFPPRGFLDTHIYQDNG